MRWLGLIFLPVWAFAQQTDFKRPAIDVQLGQKGVHMAVGLRPYRRGGIRLEREPRGPVVFWHHYGHGGAGFTLSWGSAQEVIDLAAADLKRAKRVVVLGGGVIGLTTALELQNRGHQVELLAADFVHTTSAAAGGLWKPTGVDLWSMPPKQVYRIITRSWKKFEALEKASYPVRRMPYFQAWLSRAKKPGTYSLDDLAAKGIIPARKQHARLPIEGMQVAGREFRVFLMDVPPYLARLKQEVKNKTQRAFKDVAEIVRFAGDGAVVFNCTGLGSYQLFGDKNLIPIRGQLVWVDRANGPTDQDFMISTGSGYLFPRAGEYVLGGTYEKGQWKQVVSRAQGQKILSSHRKFFGFDR